ncbi:hypothetical protein ScPMuIL_001839 [Solemya velum]
MPDRKSSSSSDSSQRQARVLANRYEIRKKLGKGNFGTAFLCRDLKSKSKDQENKVLKQIAVGDLALDETVDAMREARLLSRLDHPSIVKFHDSFIDEDHFCIVTEYCEGGDLDNKINEFKKQKACFDENSILDWFVQLLLAVHHMHMRRILHRDLKTRNIFLKKNLVKIGDFGISRILMSTADLASTFTGTPYYMSPEVLKHEGYNSKSDIWSIGCILYELCSLEHAFNGQSLMAVMYKIVEGDPPNLPDRYSKQLDNIMKLMLQKDPDKRPTATELLKLPLIAKHVNKMSEDYLLKYSSQENLQQEAQDIAQLLREKSHLSDLRDTEDEVKMRNLPPRERMRLRKLAEADKKSQELKEHAKAQLKANVTRQEKIKSSLGKQSVPAWAGGSGEGATIKDAINVKDSRLDDGPKNTSVFLTESHFDEDEYDTILKSPNRTAPLFSNKSEKLERNLRTMPNLSRSIPIEHVEPDDRPITPMKDRMVYAREFSSLDFKDGIPDKPELAETYYSQFDDEFDSSDEKEEENTVIPIKQSHESGLGDSLGMDDNTLTPDDDIVFPGEKEPGDGCNPGELTSDSMFIVEVTYKDDEKELYDCLQGVLDTADAENTMTLTDDKDADAFGPVVRANKIKNLKVECKKILGETAFNEAYDYLKKARNAYSVDSSEKDIMQGLRAFVKNPSDCFLVDQLLFLEEQASNVN